jgi:hypothetical protein
MCKKFKFWFVCVKFELWVNKMSLLSLECPFVPPWSNEFTIVVLFLPNWSVLILRTNLAVQLKGKYAIRPLLLSFLAGRSNWLNSFARLLHFYCCFQKYQYRPPMLPYYHATIWPYGHILTIWPYSHIDIWHRMASIWWRNYVDSTFLQKMREKMVWWDIFLCIFRNFLCICKAQLVKRHSTGTFEQIYAYFDDL